MLPASWSARALVAVAPAPFAKLSAPDQPDVNLRRLARCRRCQRVENLGQRPPAPNRRDGSRQALGGAVVRGLRVVGRRDGDGRGRAPFVFGLFATVEHTLLTPLDDALLAPFLGPQLASFLESLAPPFLESFGPSGSQPGGVRLVASLRQGRFLRAGRLPRGRLPRLSGGTLPLFAHGRSQIVHDRGDLMVDLGPQTLAQRVEGAFELVVERHVQYVGWVWWVQ